MVIGKLQKRKLVGLFDRDTNITNQGIVYLKRSTGFSRMSLTASLLRLGALLRNKLQVGAFFSYRCIFLLACIDH